MIKQIVCIIMNRTSLAKDGLKWLFILAISIGSPSSLADEFVVKRNILIKEIEADVHETSLYLDRKKLDPRVIQAMRDVPRHEFVQPNLQQYAYENRPLPIGHGQTISQPYIVAIMTDLVKPQRRHRVLEVGSGSGYQAAVLSKLVNQVYSIEIIPPLGEQAAARLKQLGYGNVKLKIADGYYGWEEFAPFDAIVVTAAASHIPPPLLKQLKPGGRMIIPVGSRFMTQQLLMVNKDLQGKVTTKQILPVMFVPLTGRH